MTRFKNMISKLQGKHIFLYIIFVIISSLFWLLLTLNDKNQQEYQIKLNINSIPGNTTFITDVPSIIKVQVQEKGTVALRNALTASPNITVDFRKYSNNNVFRINSSDLKDLIYKTLGNNSKIVSIFPDSIKALYTNLKPQKVPVHFNVKASSNYKYTVSGEIIHSQDSVLIYSNYKNLNIIDFVETENISINNLEDTVSVEIAIKPIKNVKIVPDKLSVTIPVEPLIVKKTDVKIRAIGLPTGYSLITFPSTIKASYLIPLNELKETQDIFAEVYYNEINTFNKKLKIHSYPTDWKYGTINFEKDSIDYIIDKSN